MTESSDNRSEGSWGNTSYQALLERLLAGTITLTEKEALARIIREDLNSEGKDNHIKELASAFEGFEPAERRPREQVRRLFERMLIRARQEEQEVQQGLRGRDGVLIAGEQLVKRVPLYRRPFFRAAAAAALILVAVSIWVLFKPADKMPQMPGTQQVVLRQDVAPPDRNRAMITLADGQKVYLDSASTGTLATQGTVEIKKLRDGQISYTGKDDHSEPTASITYNTLFNPRGSKVIGLTLGDGSKVWLNAESSLKYPTAFPGNERKVEITGEAYFEVAHDRQRPFTVSKDGTMVQVLGTQFNMNAYEDEHAIQTTLIEGSVRVGQGHNTLLLQPGQQAYIRENNLRRVTPDIEQVLAWKNGLFNFQDKPLQEVLRQLTRWYDINVIYEGVIPDKFFVGEISRNTSLSGVLKILERTGVHFRLQPGRRLIVTP